MSRLSELERRVMAQPFFDMEIRTWSSNAGGAGFSF
jgi:hypothetical protein